MVCHNHFYKLTNSVSALVCQLSDVGLLELSIWLPHLHLATNLCIEIQTSHTHVEAAYRSTIQYKEERIENCSHLRPNQNIF